MRKGVVMEQNRDYTIVMTGDGQFHRAKRVQHAEVGMEIHFEALSKNRTLFRWTQLIHNHYSRAAIIALVILLTVFPMYTWYGSNQAYAYVNIDINPSVELELNDDMQVIDMVPHNAESESLIENLEDWKKQDASEVTFDLIQLSKDMGLVNEKNQVLIGVSYIKSDHLGDLSSDIETYLTDQSLGMSVAAFLVPENIRKQAHDTGKSVNAFLADTIEKDQPEGDEMVPSVTVEDEDKEIIQSFYNEDTSTSEEPGQATLPSPKPTVEDQMHRVEKHKDKPLFDESHPGHNGLKKAPGLKQDSSESRSVQRKDSGKESAPGQQKKKERESNNSAPASKNEPKGKSSAPGQLKKQEGDHPSDSKGKSNEKSAPPGQQKDKPNGKSSDREPPGKQNKKPKGKQQDSSS
ncbi:anti-sigma factor domain-containing protein [Halobacillus fulvus]|nr:anti-sigma factor domain-containing protein [Halobacillus fulvus]